MKTSFNLTPTQVRILKFAAEGFGYKQIADEMNLTYRTVALQIDYSIKNNGCKKCVELVYKLSKAGIL